MKRTLRIYRIWYYGRIKLLTRVRLHIYKMALINGCNQLGVKPLLDPDTYVTRSELDEVEQSLLRILILRFREEKVTLKFENTDGYYQILFGGYLVKLPVEISRELVDKIEIINLHYEVNRK